MILPSREGAKRAPNRSQIASKLSFGLKIYKNLFQKGPERVPKPKKVASWILEAILALKKRGEELRPVCNCPGRALGEP